MNYLDLPVYKNQKIILQALADNQAVVVESPTGSGKTTQLPLILYEAGYARGGIIGVTQPRRIAAVSVSEFIARQAGVAIPQLIGYKMRFEDRTSRETKIKIMTDGILLQEMKLDPWLSKYGILIVDEAHERSLNIDFILGLLKRVLENRRDFKVIVSSATINAEVFSEYFGECPIVKIEAQRFPVTLIYDPPLAGEIPDDKRERGRPRSQQRFRKSKDDNNAAPLAPPAPPAEEKDPRAGVTDIIIDKIEAITTRFISEKREGDILVFLSGEKMIKDCMNRLAQSQAGKYLHLLPLYGRLGKEEQERVFEDAPKGKTKAVIATNIAETSVTIDGITAVIDSGLAKLNWYNPRTFTSSLIEAPVSKASANQRKGRAGRTREGVCYRLYTRRDFENRPLFTTEEIFRTDLSEVILRMADLGITNFEDFDFLASPDREGLIGGIETLNLLEALQDDRGLSSIGKLMTEFPLAPRQSRIIVEAIMRYPEVLRETVIAAAFLSTQSPYLLPPGEETDARQAHHRFRDDSGDFVSYLKLYGAYRNAPDKLAFCAKSYLDERAMAEIANVVTQLEEIVSSLQIPLSAERDRLSASETDNYLCCVGRGMIQFVCARDRGSSREGRDSSRRSRFGMYRTLTADKIIIHPGSSMFRMDPPYIVAGEIVRTSRMYAMSVSPLSRAVLERIQPGLFADGEKNFSYADRGGEDAIERRAKLKKARDFTHNIKISTEVFEIITVKGKKQALLPWEKLSSIKDDIPPDALYKGLKGTIVVDGQYHLLAGEKLSLLLALAPALDVEGALTRDWPRKTVFNSHENLPALLENLDSLAQPVVWKKRAKDLGFLGLYTDGDGNYRFKAARKFHSSLNESVSSLEALIDECYSLGEAADPSVKRAINLCYRRLSDYLG
ncbi:MAG: ATP-dependent RNA helicase [Treponema sp.]|nr:ATP-dependent RNA helicase [Treponema sp.]